MFANDKAILDMQNEHGIIEPFSMDNLQPASYDVTLSDSFKVQSEGMIMPYKSKSEAKYIELKQDSYLLPSKGFVLASTVEKVSVPSFACCRFEGKSSLGRIGLTTHVTAGFIDPGFQGNITLEIANLGNADILLEAGMSIGQICFALLCGEPMRKYGEAGNHYQGQSGTTSPWYT